MHRNRCTVCPEYSAGRKKAGAKPKNEGITTLAKQLVKLKKIDRFITSNEGINDIEEIPLTNSDCRFIYDCLSFFGLVNSSNTTVPEKYIRTMLKQSRKPYSPNYRIERFSQLKARLAPETQK